MNAGDTWLGFQVGDRVELESTSDTDTSLRPGGQGTVAGWDSRMGQLGVDWDNGSRLMMAIARGPAWTTHGEPLDRVRRINVDTPAADNVSERPSDAVGELMSSATEVRECRHENCDKSAVAVLVYYGQGIWIEDYGLCAEHITCSDSTCTKPGEILDSEYEEPWCTPHADQFSGEETVTGPDIVLIDSDRYRELLAEVGG